MKRITRIIIAVAVFAASMLHMIWLTYLFPDMGFGGIFFFFMWLAFSTVAGVFVFILFKWMKNKIAITMLLSLLIITLVVLQVWTHTSVHDSARVQIPEFWNTFWDYPDNVEFEHLMFGNDAEKVAAMVKYRDNLPERIVVIEFEEKRFAEPTTTYLLEYRNGEWIYDESRLKLIESDENTILILNPDNPETRKICELGYAGYLDLMFDTGSWANRPCTPYTDGYINIWGRKILIKGRTNIETGAEHILKIALNIFK